MKCKHTSLHLITSYTLFSNVLRKEVYFILFYFNFSAEKIGFDMDEFLKADTILNN